MSDLQYNLSISVVPVLGLSGLVVGLVLDIAAKIPASARNQISEFVHTVLAGVAS